jgi:hypothetical protein
LEIISRGDVNYNGWVFTSIAIAENGEVDSQMGYFYHPHGKIDWDTYGGDDIVFRTFLVTYGERRVLDIRYQHLNRMGEFKTGKSRSIPVVLAIGSLRLVEPWQ